MPGTQQSNQADWDSSGTLSLQLIAAFTNPDNSNKVGNISVLKIFVISSLPVFKAEVLLSAIKPND